MPDPTLPISIAPSPPSAGSGLTAAPTRAPVDTSDVIIKVDRVVKTYGGRTVLDEMTLDVYRGETLVILGGSGSGKSTLLRMMAGTIESDGGKIYVDGQNICGMSRHSRDAYRKTIGVLFQSGALFNSMTVFDNVALPLREHTDLAEETIGIIVKMKLELVGMREAADRLPAEISGGMKKRAGLARALAMDPKVLFYDEPSAGLDPVTSAEVDELINTLNRILGVTSVVVTHEMDSAFRIADRMVLLDRGKFIKSGTPEEFRTAEDPLVRQFIHGLTEGPLTERRRGGAYEADLLTPWNRT
ncbi:MAG: ABC transporter ATP-binding protein [Phycisphaerae bacterium]